MIRSVVALCALFNVAMCVAIAWRVTVVPENHWGVDQRWLIPLFALQLVSCVLPRVPLTRAARGLLAVTSALGLALVVLVTPAERALALRALDRARYACQVAELLSLRIEGSHKPIGGYIPPRCSVVCTTPRPPRGALRELRTTW